MDVLAAVETQRRRARLAVWLLGASAALCVAGIASGGAQWLLLERAATAGISEAEASANDARHGAIGILQLAALVATGIAWLRWASRAYGNLGLMGSGRTDYSGAAVIFTWFVPIMNLFRPYQITKELWLRSREANAVADLSGRPAPGLLAAWWAAWLVSSMLGQVVLRTAREAQGVDALQVNTVAGGVSDLVSLAGALLAIRIVREIDASQRAASVAAHAVEALS